MFDSICRSIIAGETHPYKGEGVSEENFEKKSKEEVLLR